MRVISKEYIPSIGIIEGGGTGRELAAIFQHVVQTIYNKTSITERINFISFFDTYNYVLDSYHTFKEQSLNESNTNALKTSTSSINDLINFINKLDDNNSIGAFRTAINTETLYLLRAKEKILKAVPLTISNAKKEIKLLLLRDQLQGYYTNNNTHISNNKINIDIEYSSETFELLLKFLLKRCDEIEFNIDIILFIYKYHLFGLRLEEMISNAVTKAGFHNTPFMLCQPDSGITYLLHKVFAENHKNIAVVCGNEVGDVLLETLIYYYKLGTNETFYTTNYVLEHNNFQILQTMHGSADDLAGKNTVNPTATLKACAHALEQWLGIIGAQQKMNDIVSSMLQTEPVRQDHFNTEAFVRCVIDKWHKN